MLEVQNASAEAGFSSVAEASRRVAGVAAAARAVRLLADQGARDIRLIIDDEA